ncbi:MAG: AMP-binding protein [Tidjanibacter sp.]|nr:AMP-binding protein [Tidjanibacter sp.]MBQ5930792.1 AMP-binding protein [Tidjanibacter sp.]
MRFKTLKQILDNSVKVYAKRTALSMFERESMTYGEFGERVKYVQQLLLDSGLCAGDKVVLLSSSMPNWGVCYFAATCAGMVIVPILPDFSGPELDKIIAHSEAKAMCVSDKLYTKLSPETVEKMNVVIRTKNLAVVNQTCTTKGEGKVPEPEDLAAIIYTSGTTSTPKGVMLTHQALAQQVGLCYAMQNVNEEDVFLSILPLAHTYECSLGLLLPLSYGSQVVYLDRPPTASALMPAFRSVRPTIILSVPLIMEKVFRSQVKAKFTKTKFMRWLYSCGVMRKLLHRVAGVAMKKLFGGRVRFFGIGGAKVERETERFMREAHFPYAIGYGLTETAPLLYGSAPQETKLQMVGKPAIHVEGKLIDVNPETGEGELVVKTPCIMQGYFKNPEATAEAFTEDGWFRTKDLCVFDKKTGYLVIKGRANNMIVGATGENIYPEEIESVINTHHLVTESIVVADKGALVALVALDKEKLEEALSEFKDNVSNKYDELMKEIREYVNSRVGKFARVSQVEEQKDGFEKTPTQKIKRFLYKRDK